MAMAKPFRRAWRRLCKAGAAVIGSPAALWRFARRLPHDAALRERTMARAVFAGIFAFAVASFDFLVTGGMEWSPDLSAVAAQPVHAVVADWRGPADVEAPPALIAPELQPLDEMAAPNEDLLGGPGTVLAAWRRPHPDLTLLPDKPQTVAFETFNAHPKSPQRL